MPFQLRVASLSGVEMGGLRAPVRVRCRPVLSYVDFFPFPFEIINCVSLYDFEFASQRNTVAIGNSSWLASLDQYSTCSGKSRP